MGMGSNWEFYRLGGANLQNGDKKLSGATRAGTGPNFGQSFWSTGGLVSGAPEQGPSRSSTNKTALLLVISNIGRRQASRWVRQDSSTEHRYAGRLYLPETGGGEIF